jgi:hypothetical protein
MVKTAWHRDGEEQYGVRAWARRLGILLAEVVQPISPQHLDIQEYRLIFSSFM